MTDQNDGFLQKLFKRPRLIVSVIGILTIFFALQLPRTELDNNNVRFIPDDDEAMLTSKYIDDTFGSSLFILVGLERKYGDVFDPVFLNRIREFNQRIEQIEITGNINSIVSSDYIFSEDDSIVVQKLVGEQFTGTPAEIAALKQRILSWDIYRRALVSDDFRATQILVPLEITSEMVSQPEHINSFIDIRDIAKEMFDGYADVYVTGLPLISSVINEAMSSDLTIMIPLVILVVLLVLFFSFRRFTPVILPLVTVLIAVIWSVGAMPLFGVKLSVISTVLPVILIAVGSAYGIHIMTHYLKSVMGMAEISIEEHREIVLTVVRKIGKAVLLAAVTTMAGFCSFAFTTVLPIREFGIFSTFGVLVSFLIAITLIPGLLLIRGPKKIKTIKSTAAAEMKIAEFFAGITKKKGTVIFTVAIILIISIFGIRTIIIDNVFIEYFKSSTDIARSDKFIREKFGGSKIVNIVVQADSTEALFMPEVLGTVNDLEAYLEERIPEVGKVMGFTDLVKRMNQVFNADESPDGLAPVPGTSQAASNAPSASNGFGFDNFGFDDFGFDPVTPPPSNITPSNSSSSSGSSRAALQIKPKEQTTITSDDLVQMMREAAFSGKDRHIDVNSLVREMEKLINFEGASYYEIPANPERYGKTTPQELSQLVANYLILLSGNISSYANDTLSPTAIRSTVQLRTLGNADTDTAIKKIHGFVDAHFPDSVKILIGGSALVESSLNHLVVQSQLTSVFISFMLIFLLIALLNKSFMAGIVGIAPLSICVIINYAIMGYAGIKLNIGTSMMASLCIGIGTDYTIHYMEAFKRELHAAAENGVYKTGDFILKTFTTSGKAILINAISVGAGFAVLMLSQFVMLQDLGFLIALAMGTSAIISLTVLPVLLLMIKPKFIYKDL